MAELVDALVSNTSGFTSMPVRSRLWVQREKFERVSLFFLCKKTKKHLVIYKKNTTFVVKFCIESKKKNILYMQNLTFMLAKNTQCEYVSVFDGFLACSLLAPCLKVT